MIDMRMGQHDTINLCRIEKELTVIDQVLLITSLEQTAIQQDFKTVVQRDQVRAPGDLSCRSAEFNVHVRKIRIVDSLQY